MNSYCKSLIITQIFIFILLGILFLSASGQEDIPSRIKIRLFSEGESDPVFFTVASGRYLFAVFPGDSGILEKGESAVMIRYNGRLAVKTASKKALIADSVIFYGTTEADRFFLRNNHGKVEAYKYSGNLFCYLDLETVMLINDCDIEEYIVGVVRAEGGTGKNEEYFKTQAVIARTYTYRNFYRHEDDGFNLCDGTHCQAYKGISEEKVIVDAVQHTRGMVIVTPDSNLIIAAFHSNCGGQTSPSEFVWMLSLPYLGGVNDPYCTGSGNSIWKKKVSLNDWIKVLEMHGYRDGGREASDFIFDMPERMMNYSTGSFSIPANVLRNSLSLRSAWFSVFADGDSLLLKGRGYGHGVGLCQEGAMVMATKGYGYEDIISFYYPGVKLLNITAAKKVERIKK